MKKLMATTLASCMIMSMFSQSVHATTSFTDTSSHWAKDSIEKWADLNIVNGYSNLFYPSNNIIRGDVALILDRVMGYELYGNNVFADLDNYYYTTSVLKANYAGIILGDGVNIRPTDNITREEASVMICRAMHFDTSNYTSTGFSDNLDISSWALNSVAYLSQAGIVNGRPDNTFDPSAYIERAEFVAILDRAIALLLNDSEEYSENVDGNVVVNSDEATLSDMTIKGDLILAEGIGDGEVYLDNVTVYGDIIIKGGGENSIYLNDVTVLGEVLVSKVQDSVRVVLSGKTSIFVMELDENAIIETSEFTGTINEIIINDGEIFEFIGDFDSITNNVLGSDITIDGSVAELVLNSSSIVNGDAYASDTELNVETEVEDEIPTTPETEGEYAITSDTDITNGYVTFSHSNADEDETITIILTPDEGYVLSSLSVVDSDKNAISISDYTFEMPASDVFVSVSFVKKSYTITTPTDENGTIEVSSSTAYIGDLITLTPSSINGYTLSSLSVKDANNEVIPVTNQTFTMPSSNVTISATFSKNTYEIIKNAENGTIVTTTTYSNTGDTVSVTTEPAEGYTLSSLTVTDADGVVIPLTNNEITMPSSNIIISATFVKATYTISFDEDFVTVSTKTAQIGDEVVITANEDYDLTELDITILDTAFNIITLTNDTFTMPGNNVVILAKVITTEEE